MKVSVIDLGVNNIRSVVGALEHVGVQVSVATDPSHLSGPCLVPGIGHFGFVSDLMAQRGWVDALRAHAAAGRPLLGICLGMQLLLDGSEEAPGAPGLGVLSGQVQALGRLPVGQERIPVTGWRKLRSPLEGLDGRNMYLNHSFGLPGDHPLCRASYDYGAASIAAVVGAGPVVGLQFHPEKSGLAGLHLLHFCLEKISGQGF